MNTTEAFVGLSCVDCDGRFDPADVTHDCPDCGGVLDPEYDLAAVDLDRATLAGRDRTGVWRYREVLPFDTAAAISTDEGATPLVDCPTLADHLGVDRVLCKDEGRNPTGSVADRGASVAVTAAAEHGADDVGLPSTGNGGQAVAAYAARADLASHVYVPSRTPFVNKAMINVHGGDMQVVGGRYPDAEREFREWIGRDDKDWYSLAPFETPYRHEGAKTVYYEVAEGLDWSVPDHVVVPTGHGTTLVGMAKAARECERLGLTDDSPAFTAAQAEGCAPVADAVADDRVDPAPVEYPDTICGGVEVPDPAGGGLAIDAVRETDGYAVATPDDDILESAVAVAQQEGVEMGATPGVAASAAWALADRGAFDADDTVVLVNTAAGNKEDDLLRSHLMGQGV